VASYAGLVAGYLGDPKTEAYSAAKHGVIGLTRGFGQGFTKPCTEVFKKHGVKAYAICPWFVDTRMVRDAVDNVSDFQRQLKTRLLLPEEVARAAEDVLKEDINGSVYTVFPSAATMCVPSTNIFLGLWIMAAARILFAFGYKRDGGVVGWQAASAVTLVVFFIGWILLKFFIFG